MNSVVIFVSVFTLLTLRINGVESRTLADDQRITSYAKCRTEGGYLGASTSVTTYNPQVSPSQYSATKLKLQIGPDSIETGWRVDPTLYGDSKTRFYIHTDARDQHCFNTLCPGFVITNKSVPLDQVFDKISGGGTNWAIDLSITSVQATARWVLELAHREIGYWPVSIFQKPGAADSVEWGGEVSGTTALPAMGSGGRQLAEDTAKDAFFFNVKVMNGPTTGGPAVDPTNVKCDSDSSNYEVKSEGNVGSNFQFLIFYGGPST